MKALSTTIILLFTVISATFAQKDKVDWRASSVKNTDGTYNLVFTATIEKGWHLYSQHLKGDDGPVPTTFSFPASDKYNPVGAVTEPKPIVKVDKAFDVEVSYFENEVQFVQKIKPSCDKPGTVKAAVEFMVCNNEMCLPPKTVEFEVPLN